MAEHSCSWCPSCGPDVAIDEDGCCAMCGADAVGEGADYAGSLLQIVQRAFQLIDQLLIDQLLQVKRERDDLRASLDRPGRALAQERDQARTEASMWKSLHASSAERAAELANEVMRLREQLHQKRDSKEEEDGKAST